MWTIIILVIANFIIVRLFGINILKHLLFNPKINASIVGLGIIMNIISAVVDRKQVWLIIPWIVSILDCIQDIIWGENYYGSVEDHISPLYAAKCITSILTRGISRAAFFLFTSLCIPRIALADVKRTFEGKRPTEVDPQYPYGSSFVANFFDRFYSIEFLRSADPYITNAVLYVIENLENLFVEWKAVRYDSFNSLYGCPYTDHEFVRKYSEKCKPYRTELENRIRNNLEEGKLLTNEKCVDEEFQLRENRLAKAVDKAKNKKLIVKFTEKMTEEGRQALANAQAEIENTKSELFLKESVYTYVDSKFYEDCKRKVLDALSDKASMPVRTIVKLDKLSFLNDVQRKDIKLDQRWREYFVIFIMQELIQEGIVKDEAVLGGILDTHQYGLVNGKTILCRDKDNPVNPKLYDDPELGECS
ncbi:MAG: hypothetical protein HDR09_10040 [Lachnospiraceae bacterium]|nr:hypothetical protein [Lachnospiraceae bacterium]